MAAGSDCWGIAGIPGAPSRFCCVLPSMVCTASLTKPTPAVQTLRWVFGWSCHRVWQWHWIIFPSAIWACWTDDVPYEEHICILICLHFDSKPSTSIGLCPRRLYLGLRISANSSRAIPVSDVTLSPSTVPSTRWAAIKRERMNGCVFSEVTKVLGRKEHLKMHQVYWFLCYWTPTFPSCFSTCKCFVMFLTA